MAKSKTDEDQLRERFDGPDDNGYYRCLRCAALVPSRKKDRLLHLAWHQVDR